MRPGVDEEAGGRQGLVVCWNGNGRVRIISTMIEKGNARCALIESWVIDGYLNKKDLNLTGHV